MKDMRCKACREQVSILVDDGVCGTCAEDRRPPVYVEQFGGYWKLTDAQWIDLLKGGVAGEGHTLPEDQQLRGRPKFIRSDRYGRDQAQLYCIDGHRFHQPLDWGPEEYAEQLAEEMADRADPQA